MRPERVRGRASTGAYAIMATPVTNREYAAFVADAGHRAPEVSRAFEWCASESRQ